MSPLKRRRRRLSINWTREFVTYRYKFIVCEREEFLASWIILSNNRISFLMKSINVQVECNSHLCLGDENRPKKKKEMLGSSYRYWLVRFHSFVNR